MSMNVIDLDEKRKKEQAENKPKSDLDTKLDLKAIRDHLLTLMYDLEVVKKDILRIEEELNE